MTATSPADLTDVLALLQRSGLPVSDLQDANRGGFRVVELAGALAGCVAVEAYGTHGLLRSLAVDASARGAGLGTRLVEAAEAFARQRELETLALLTETAEPFFERLGYARMERADVPRSLLQSSAFASGGCCASAAVMGKSLSPARPEAPAVRPVR